MDTAAVEAPRPLTQRDYDRTYDAKNPGRRKARNDRLLAEGLCISCGSEPLVTATRCFDCADKMIEQARLYRP